LAPTKNLIIKADVKKLLLTSFVFGMNDTYYRSVYKSTVNIAGISLKVDTLNVISLKKLISLI